MPVTGRASDETDYHEPPRGGVSTADPISADQPAPHKHHHHSQNQPDSLLDPKKPPPLVKQITQYSCWAAALQSWLEVAEVPGRPHITQEQITAQHQDETRSGFDIPQLRQLLAAWGMDTTLVYFEDFDTVHIKDALTKRGPLYVGTRIQFSYWHAVVLFDVQEPTPGSKDLQPRFWVMNPGTGKIEGWLEKDFFRESVGHPLIIGFKSIGPTGRVR